MQYLFCASISKSECNCFVLIDAITREKLRRAKLSYIYERIPTLQQPNYSSPINCSSFVNFCSFLNIISIARK